MATSPYSTIRPFFSGQAPAWMSGEDAERIQSYDSYYNFYWNSPESFRVLQRGSEANPIYVPSAKIVIETMQRYAGAKMSTYFDPEVGTPEQQAQAAITFQQLFSRERLLAQYHSNKRFGLVKGDWCFHITANPLKAEGRRLRIRSLTPDMYFPIHDPDDVEHVTGARIIEEVVEGEDTLLSVQTYYRSDDPNYPGTPGETGPIFYEHVILELENWDTPDRRVVREESPAVFLDPRITAIPIYHIRNIEEPGNPFGSSELRGIERVIAGINQAVSDEELALALEGLGVYVTDAGTPVDEEGSEVPWGIGPGRVVEVATGRKFDRVQGINSVEPFQNHINYLADQVARSTSATDAAQGALTVEVAESGIALQLRMSPALATAEERDEGISGVLNQMLFDLRAWFEVYEGVNMQNVLPLTRFGQKLPIDTKRRFDELMQMVTAVPPLISASYFRDAVRELGYDLPVDMADQISQEQAGTDPVGDRLSAEADGSVEITGEDEAVQ